MSKKSASKASKVPTVLQKLRDALKTETEDNCLMIIINGCCTDAFNGIKKSAFETSIEEAKEKDFNEVVDQLEQLMKSASK